MTMHGTLMIFFVLTTAPIAAIWELFLANSDWCKGHGFPAVEHDVVLDHFPVLCGLDFVFFVQDGPPISGWTAYPPLSAVGQDAGPGEGLGQTLWLISISIFCIAQAARVGQFHYNHAGLANQRHDARADADHHMDVVRNVRDDSYRVCCFIARLFLLILDSVAGTSFFVPAGLVISDQLQPHAGGTPLLWQHLFWFFGHPEVYIAILPAVGIVSLILPAFARKPILGPRIMIGCSDRDRVPQLSRLGTSHVCKRNEPFLGDCVFTANADHHDPIRDLGVALDWHAVWREMRFTTAGLFCIAFVSVFITGGVAGFFLAQPSIDSYLHATYFVVAHFHFVMGVAAIFGIFAGTYFWFPKMFGRMMSESLGKWHFWLTFIGVYCIFMPMYFLGFAGNVRRYSYFTDDYLIRLIPIHKFITIAALLTGAVQFIFFFNLMLEPFSRPEAADNPWQATTLEWSLPFPS